MRRTFSALLALIGAVQCAGLPVIESAEPSKPNIVWILAEEIGPDLSCYGVSAIQTPVLDKLAAEGVRVEPSGLHTLR